jgi:hypothetical protein
MDACQPNGWESLLSQEGCPVGIPISSCSLTPRQRFFHAARARFGSPDVRCHMSVATVRVVQCLILLLLCAHGVCQSLEQAPLHRPTINSIQNLAGTYESEARGDTLFADRTSTNGVPLFTLTLETNGTYLVFCASVFVEPKIDGGGYVVPGYEFGTWRKGGDRYHPEMVFTATNRIHMKLLFPDHMKVDWRDLSRLTTINLPSEMSEGPPRWVALSSPYFCRKSP